MRGARTCLGAVAMMLALTGCDGDPKAKADRHIAKGDGYAAQQKLVEATIEYRNALQAQPDRADAHYKLANAYSRAGEPAKAYAEYARAADLDRSNIDAQINAGTLLLMAGQFDEAKRRAQWALDADPKSVRAHILLGNALAGLKESGAAVRQIEQAVAIDPGYAPAHTALGAIQLSRGARDAARASFEKAVQLAPTSTDARLALANFNWAVKDAAGTERELKAALAVAPDNLLVHRALALFYLTERRAVDAEPHFKALAAASPEGKLALSDYYRGTGRLDDALKPLEGIAGTASTVREAQVRVATIHQQRGRHAEAVAIANRLVADAPDNVEMRVFRARLLLADRATSNEAWTDAQAATKADPASAEAHYTLGLAALSRGDSAAAEAAFERTVAINPRVAAAELQLARLRLARGDSAAALTAAEHAAVAHPADTDATVTLARILRARREFDRARREVMVRLESSPKEVRLLVELGWIEMGAGQPSRARAAFDRALAIAPAGEDARRGVIGSHLAARDVAGARARIGRWVQDSTANPAVQVLAARVDLADQAPAAAEQRLLEVIRTTPDQLEAYELLGSIYVQQGNTSAALDKYRALAARAPDPTGPATVVGMLLDSQSNRQAARAQYEAVLARNPRAGVAANNLAWLLAEDGQYDEALRWAQIAAETLRGRPEPQDTLGWVHLKRNNRVDALAAFERALSLAPDNRLYQEHKAAATAALAAR